MNFYVVANVCLHKVRLRIWVLNNENGGWLESGRGCKLTF